MMALFIILFGYIGYLTYQWHIANLIAKTPNLSIKKAELLAKQAIKTKRLKYNQ